MIHSYAKDQFGKAIDAITADDLAAYFSIERDESLTLEFKSFYQKEGDIKHKENGVLRAICAFLNSSGGLLIWGAPIGIRNAANEKVFVGELSPVEKRYHKDDFINKISTRIFPFAPAVQFRSIETHPGKFVYLIDVPESEAKPHQFDNLYFMRLDGQTKPIPHYLLQALFNQIKLPVLMGHLRVIGMAISSFHEPTNITIRLDLEASIFNESKNLNDTGVYTQLVTTLGTFIPTNNPAYTYNDKVVTVTDASSLITYALPTVRTFSLLIDWSTYQHLPYQRIPVEVAMSFGSKHSNTKMGKYTFLLKHYELKGTAQHITNSEVLSSMISIEKTENIAVNEMWPGNEPDGRKSMLRGI